MSKRKFVYNVAVLAVAVWNTDRLVSALRDQSRDIARDVVREIARERVKARKDGSSMDGIASEVFAELGKKLPPANDNGPVYDTNEQMLKEAFATVTERVLR